jgi:predicted NUDIX family phosphoesterase
VTAKLEERVLVIPTSLLTAAGTFHGFSPRVDHYLPRLLAPAEFSFRRRSDVEMDPTFKQIIPYVILKCGNQVFHYVRGKRGTETRLQSLRSIGIGGHINPSDQNLFSASYQEGMLRELAEEVELGAAYVDRCIGLINDDSTSVGRVHLGVVHVFELSEPSVGRRDPALTQAGFAPLHELRAQRQEFESWSQFVLDGLGP